MGTLGAGPERGGGDSRGGGGKVMAKFSLIANVLPWKDGMFKVICNEWPKNLLEMFLFWEKRRNIKRKQMSFEMTSQGVKDKLGLMWCEVIIEKKKSVWKLFWLLLFEAAAKISDCHRSLLFLDFWGKNCLLLNVFRVCFSLIYTEIITYISTSFN